MYIGMPDYSQGKIYRTWNNNFSHCYIGSTCQPLSKRMTRHRSDYNQYSKNKIRYITVFSLFDEYGVENCKIELLEAYPCKNREELEAREGHHQRKNQCINKFIAGRTDKQYYQDNRERILEQCRIYRDEHKEERKEYDKQRYENNKDEINEQQRQYRQDNLEYVRERDRNNYYETKRAKRLTKYTCECGETLTHGSKARHEKRQHHLHYLKSLEETN